MSELFCQEACQQCPLNELDPLNRNIARLGLQTYMAASAKPGLHHHRAFTRQPNEAFVPFLMTDEEHTAATKAFVLISAGECESYQHPGKE